MLFLAIILPRINFPITGNIIRGIVATLLMCMGLGSIRVSIWEHVFGKNKIH